MRMRNIKCFNKLNLLHNGTFVFFFIGVLVETKQFLQVRVSLNSLVTLYAPQMLYCGWNIRNWLGLDTCADSIWVILICNPPGYSKDMMSGWVVWFHLNYTSRSRIRGHLFGSHLWTQHTVSLNTWEEMEHLFFFLSVCWLKRSNF